MVTHYSAELDVHIYCDNGHRMIPVVEGQDSTCSCFNCNYCLPHMARYYLLFISIYLTLTLITYK